MNVEENSTHCLLISLLFLKHKNFVNIIKDTISVIVFINKFTNLVSLYFFYDPLVFLDPGRIYYIYAIE